MAMTQTKISLPLIRFVQTDKTQLLCEGTALLPDARYVGAKILHADASVRMGEAELAGDRLSVSGVVLFDVLYTGGDAPVGHTQTQYAFTHTFSVPDAAPGMQAEAFGRVDSVSAVLTGARVSFNAVVSLWAQGEGLQTLHALADLSGDDAQTRTCETPLCTARVQGMRRMLLEGDDELPVPTDGKVLYFTHRIQIRDQQLCDGYVRVQGDLILDALSSGAAPLIKTTHAFPFDLDVPLEGVCDNFSVSVQAQAQELAVTVTPADEPDGLGVMHVEGTLLCRAAAEQTRPTLLLSDAYSTGDAQIDLETDAPQFYIGTQRAGAGASAHLTLSPDPDLPPMLTARTAFVSPVYAQAADEHGTLCGVLRVRLIYSAADESLCAVQEELPFEAHFDLDTPPDCELTLTCGETTISHTSDRAELRVQLLLETARMQFQTVPVVLDAHETPCEVPQRAQLIVHFAGAGDTLWSIAKAHRVSPESIRRLNPAAETLSPGDRLILRTAAPK